MPSGHARKTKEGNTAGYKSEKQQEHAHKDADEDTHNEGHKDKQNLKTHGKPHGASKKAPSLMQVSDESHAPNLHELLPESILALARVLFEKEDVIADVVANSVLVNLTYAGVKMSLRMNKDDDAVKRMGEESQWFGYDLDTLGDVRDDSKDMLNMLDIGGNYGVVSIAAYKKYAEKLRVITVEPIPTTFFFLKWNLYLNGVPDLEKAGLDKQNPEKAALDSEGHTDPLKTAGVMALNRGSADVEGEDLHFCFDPKSSMNSRMCECQRGDDHCIIVPSVTINTLAGMFGLEPIAMVKMDCEGCEFKSLPALAQPEVSKRVRRLAGELHLPDESLEALACRWDKGRLMSKCSQKDEGIACGVELTCP